MLSFPRDGLGYRHLYTAGEGGTRGSAGFQTVAYSAALHDDLDRLEQHVAGFRPPWREGQADDEVARVDLLADRPDVTAVTRFSPAPPGASGRPGNYLADTLLVPTAWSRRFEGDLDTLLTACPRAPASDTASLRLPPVELCRTPVGHSARSPR